MFERVLLAVDGSDHSQRAVELVAGLGGQVKSDVLVFHVREKVATRGGLFDAHEEDEGIADRIAARLKESGVSARPEEVSALHGLVANKITQAATDHGAELIAMGTRGLGDVGGLFLGSVSHKVMHQAECPVLIVR